MSKNSKSKFDNLSLEEISYPEISEEFENIWKNYLAYIKRVKTEYSKITPEEHKYIHDFVPKNKKRLVLAISQLGFSDFTKSDIKG